MSLRNFFIYSGVIHLIILVGIYFLPPEVIKKPKEFITTLVSPDTFMQPQQKPPVPEQPPVQPVPRPSPPRASKVPPPLFRPPSVPTPESPVVPGEGSDSGRPLPDGIRPKGDAGKETEGGTDRSATKDKGPLSPDEYSDKPGYSLREKLYDPLIIGQIAKKDLERKAKKDDSVTFDTSEYRYAGYMKKLREKIENIWKYPPDAKKKGIYGDLYIRFTIKKDGSLGPVELVRTSGYKSLDDAALQALKDGEPYWPLPSEWGMDSRTILGHFIYSTYGYYIR